MSDDTQGRFVWRELITTALDTDRDFYTRLFGWTAKATDMGAGPYTLYQKGEEQVAGMMAPMMPDVPSFWLDYITVDDVKVALERVRTLGGKGLTEEMNLPSVGSFALVQDPTGATFALFRSLTPGASPNRARPEESTFCWSQLMTTNVDRAAAFYGQLLGWEPEAMRDGVVFKRHGAPVATAMPAPTGHPSHWVPYVAVGDCDAVTARAVGLGARQLAGPTTLPDMGRFAVLAGPGGAVVALWKDESPRP